MMRLVAEHFAEQLGFVADLLPAFDGVADDLAVFVAEQIGREPAGHAQFARSQRRREHGLQPRLTGLAVASTERKTGELVFATIVRREIDERAAVPGGEMGVSLRVLVLAGRQEVEQDDCVEFVLPSKVRNLVGAGGPGFQSSQCLADRLQPLAVENPVAQSGLEKIFVAHVPAADDQIVKAGETMRVPELLGD